MRTLTLLSLAPLTFALSIAGGQTSATDPATPVAAEGEDEPPKNPPFPILVVDRGSGEPIPLARVRVLAEEQIGQLELGRAGLLGQDVWAQVAHFGIDLTADGEGVAEGPGWELGLMAVRAMTAGGCELRRLRDSPAEGVTMRLRDRGSRDVRLVHGGAPLSAGRVAVRAEVEGAFVDLTSAPIRPIQKSAELACLGRFVKNQAAGEKLWLVQAGHFSKVPSLVLDPSEIPAEPYEFAGLPVGMVDVSLEYSNGESVPSLVEVEVHCSAPDSGSPPVSYRTENGRLLITEVGLGVPLEITARRPGGAAAGRLEVQGPSSPGETVAAKLEFAEQDVLVFGQINGLDGEPMYRSVLTCKILARNVFGQREFETEMVTEPDGSFSMVLPLQARIPVRSVIVDFLLTDPNDGHVRGAAQWSHGIEPEAGGEAPRDLEMGALDMGTLQLTAPGE